MRENGVVTAVSKGSAKVKVDKKDECSKCGMCLFPKNATSTEIIADNSLNAKVGDIVTIESEGKTGLLGVVLAFLVPLLLIGVAVAINYLFINVEIWILILSVILIILWYTILAVLDKKFYKLKNFYPKIVFITKGETNEQSDRDN